MHVSKNVTSKCYIRYIMRSCTCYTLNLVRIFSFSCKSFKNQKKQDFFNPAFNSFSISISLGSKDSFWWSIKYLSCILFKNKSFLIKAFSILYSISAMATKGQRVFQNTSVSALLCCQLLIQAAKSLKQSKFRLRQRRP